MSKYFQEKQEEIKLSKYLEQKFEKYEYGLCDEETRKIRTQYLIDILGDVSLDKKAYNLYLYQFITFGPRYDVRTDKETYKGMHEIMKKYDLTSEAMDIIWGRYIFDLFEEYALIEMLERYIILFGKTDQAFELYIDLIDKVAKEHQKKYEKDACQIDELSEYSDSFKDYIKSLILKKHYTYDLISKYLPSSELVTKDEEYLLHIQQKTRIFFDSCLPISYTYLKTLVEKDTLDSYIEEPTYYINKTIELPAHFTKQDYLDSIKKQKQLKK